MNYLIQFLQHDFTLYLVLVGICGLLIGSFLNVIIVRLPIILETMYKEECRDFLSQTKSLTPAYSHPFNLLVPSSHCPKCKHKIKPWENIPIISFILLKGTCRYCKTPISLTYPAIEMLTLILSVSMAWKFGITLKTICALFLIWTLITQSLIDLKHCIIPDEITIPVLWAGLLLNCFSIFAQPTDAIIGAVAGYLTLWLVFWIFKLLTKKDGMGYGDFKLLAMLGAWFGWQQLPLILIISSVLGSIIGISLIVSKNKTLTSAIPFGPYLAIAGFISLLYGQEINALYWQSLRVTW